MKPKKNLSLLKKIVLKVADPILSRVVSLKNAHYDESCYIFGDGISIKWFDLSSFSDKPVISLNKIALHKESNSLNIKYGLFLEPWYFYPYFWDRLDSKRVLNDGMHEIFREIIKSFPDVPFFTHLSNYPVIWDSNVYFLFQTIQDPDPNSKFSKFLEECYLSGESIYKGSLHCSVSLAIFMGFKEIFLVGCDYTHEKSRSKHWFEKGEGMLTPGGSSNMGKTAYQKKFFNIACKYVKINFALYGTWEGLS